MSFENEQYVSNRIDRIEALEQEIARLKKQLAEAVEAIEVLIQDIETPSRLGLADKPNENWIALNDARQFLAKYRGGK